MSKVLVVDDDAIIVEGLLACLDLESIEAVGACSAVDARALLASGSFSVVLTDVRLTSEAEGMELLRDIREHNPLTRVATLTGYATPALERELAELGARVVLHKPVGPEVIVEVIREMLAEIANELAARGGVVDVEELYCSTHRRLMSIASRRYGFSSEDAEELLHEAWCLYLQQAQSVRAAKPWLAGTIVNLCRQELHRRARHVSADGLDETLQTSMSDDHLILEEALGRIDARSQTLLRMTAIDDCSYEEVSRSTGIAVGSVGPMLIRAKRKLRDAFSQPKVPANRSNGAGRRPVTRTTQRSLLAS